MRSTTFAAVLLLFSVSAMAAPPAPLPEAKAGFAAFRAKDYAACAAIFSDVARKYRQDVDSPEMAAACYMRAGNEAAARKQLGMAMGRGYRDCKSLRTAPDYTTLVDGTIARCEANEETFVRSVNPSLLAAYAADQWEREQLSKGEEIDIEMIKRHDRERQALVALMLERKLVRTADDYYHAAMIMQHGGGVAAYTLAQKLVKRAVELRPWFPPAQWLYAATTDRLLHGQKKPQIFGTQYSHVEGKWTLEPFDQNAVSDAERARWRVPSLAERLAFIAELNARK